MSDTRKISGHLGDIKRAWKRDATPYLGFTAIAFAFGNLLYGVDTGSFGSIQTLPSFLRDFATERNHKTGAPVFTTKERAIMNSVVWPGKLLGTFAFEPLARRIGYRNCMYFAAAVQCIALIVQLTANSWETFSGGRIIAYFAVGIVENTVPSYLSEIAPASLRGFFAGVMNIVVASGQLWGAGMGRAFASELSSKGWMVCAGVQLIPAVAIFLLVPFCQESPRWLLMAGKHEQAQKSLDRIRPKEASQDATTTVELEALAQAIECAEGSSHGSWLELCRGTYFRRTMIASWMFACQQLCGNQFINLYGPTFFKVIGLQTLAFTYTSMITAVGIVAAIVAVLLVDFVGRRRMLMLGIGVSIIFTAIAGSLGFKDTLSSADIDVIVASFTMIMVGNRISVNPLCWVIASEVGGVRMRKKILTVGSSFDVLWAFIMSLTIPYMIGIPGSNLGAKVALIFMGFCILAFLFVIFFVPELSGRSLEEVDELFEKNLWAWQFAKAETHGVGATIRQLEAGQAVEKFGHPNEQQDKDGGKDIGAHARPVSVV